MKGDFTGFSFDGIHSSQLNIVHVSSSDRYDEELFPEIKDKTIEIPNNHGEYYYGSTYGTRSFEINIAFDSVTETQFRKIRQLFSTSKVCELIFDERPYKVYYAKAESPVELSYVCFDEPKKHIDESGTARGVRWIEETHTEKVIDEETGQPTDETISIVERVREPIYPYIRDEGTQRIYKGEGTINLICHFPFARQLYKIKELYNLTKPIDGYNYLSNAITKYDNVEEWIDSSGILDALTYNSLGIDQVKNAENTYRYEIPVYNPGDLNVGFCLYLPFNNEGKICANDGKNVIIINGDDNILYLNKEINRQNPIETGILINTTNHLIEGVVYRHVSQIQDSRHPSWITTGTIYNQYIVSGDFPHIVKTNDWYFNNSFEITKQAIYIDCGPLEKTTTSTQSTDTNTDTDTDINTDTETTETTNTIEGVKPDIDIYYNYLYF